MELIRFLLARSRRTLILSVTFGFLSGAFNSGLLALVNAAISHYRELSVVLPLLFVALCVLAPLTRVVSELLLVRLGQNAIYTLRTELAAQVVAVPLQRLERAGFHRILSVLTDDVPSISNIVSIIPLLCINLGVVGSCLIFMGWLDWKLLLIVLGFMIAGIVTYQLGVQRAWKHFVGARERDNEMQQHFQGLIRGIKELKLHRKRREAFLKIVLQNTAGSARQGNVSALSIYTVAASWGQLLVFVMIGLVVFEVARHLNITGAAITGFSFSLLYLMSPLQVVMNSIPGLARANVAIGNVQGLGLTLMTSAMPEELSSTSFVTRDPVHLELRSVAYVYRREESSDEFTLGPISLSISPGEMVFITGGNGSGKTTLAKLITGLYSPDAGEIRYNGIPVTDQNRDSFRQSFSAIFSDFHLFDSLLGLEEYHLDSRAREYLARFRLDHKVLIENGVFSTTNLSQGQRKRLALLTACLEDRPIYFFDEWAADQDPVFKEVFYLKILPELKLCGKTVIVITHDDRYYSAADRIVNLESGQLSAMPTFFPNSATAAEAVEATIHSL